MKRAHSVTWRSTAQFAGILLSTLALYGAPLSATETAHRVSAPVISENVAVYFVHGPSAAGPVPLTLSEALAQRVVEVTETGNVNALKIRNIGTADVFIQSGDIVKGGKQDRVLSVSLLVPKMSGPHDLDAFCVEQARWAPRGQEDAKRFASADEAVPSRAIKYAVRAPKPAAAPQQLTAEVFHLGTRHGDRAPTTEQSQRRAAAAPAGTQGEVWGEVQKLQSQLSANLGRAVQDQKSQSSLQLSLESEAVQQARLQRQAHLTKALRAAGPDVVGVIFAINGKFNSAEIYASTGLFDKLWPKLSAAVLTEALAEAKPASTSAVEAPSIDQASAFLENVRGASPVQTNEVGGLMRNRTVEASQALFVEASTHDGTWLHRSYVAK